MEGSNNRCGWDIRHQINRYLKGQVALTQKILKAAATTDHELCSDPAMNRIDWTGTYVVAEEGFQFGSIQKFGNLVRKATEEGLNT
jgi:putative methionine-R-sulfoxide reductase with GAF domain